MTSGCCYMGRIEPLEEDNSDKQTSKTSSSSAYAMCCCCCCDNCCKRLPLWVLPIVTAIWFIVAIFLTFGIAIGSDHNNVEDVPYISHTAVHAPQIYIFSQFINIGAVMLMFIGILRLLYVKEILSSTQTRILFCQWFCFNTFTFIVGLICAFGLTLIANFPTGLASVGHHLGGVLGFGGGTVYCVLQTVISYKIYREKNTGYSKCVVILQIILSIAIVCLLVIFVLFFAISLLSYSSDDYYTSTEFKISSVAEWTYIFGLMGYMLTFIPEFRRMEFKSSLFNINTV